MYKNFLYYSVFFAMLISCTRDPQLPCINKNCECPPGYTGPKCDQRNAPTRLYITKIEVIDFLDYPNMGSIYYWDYSEGPGNSFPDIYPALFNASNSSVWVSSTYYPDATSSGSIYAFTPSSEILISNPLQTYSIKLYDYDQQVNSDDLICSLNFTPFSVSNGMPTVLDIAGNFSVPYASGTASVRLTVRYEF